MVTEQVTFYSVDTGDMSVGINPTRFKVTIETNLMFSMDEYKKALAEMFDIKAKDVLEESEYQAEIEAEEMYIIRGEINRILEAFSYDKSKDIRATADKVVNVINAIRNGYTNI